jgi:hypothetical protein
MTYSPTQPVLDGSYKLPRAYSPTFVKVASMADDKMSVIGTKRTSGPTLRNVGFQE